MSSEVFRRLVWKEYRVQRGFWIALVALAVLGQLAVFLIPMAFFVRLQWLFGVAVLATIFYALGSGAMLFAAEQEEGTVERLRVLAVPPWALLLGKMTFSVSSTAALTGLLGVAALAFARGRLPQGDFFDFLASEWWVLLFEPLIWGALGSLLCRRVIHAVVFAVVA